jgi:mono/diheme cytochrome c family protein
VFIMTNLAPDGVNLMKKILIGAMGTGVAASLAWIGAALAQAPARNVWDGVFTADQAAQGKTAFDGKCAICHGAELTGEEMAPPLSGGTFLSNWSGQSVGDLFTRIHTTMPASDPGSLSNAETASILAYILSFNKFPAGATPLPSDDAALGAIALTAEKPAGK